MAQPKQATHLHTLLNEEKRLVERMVTFLITLTMTTLFILWALGPHGRRYVLTGTYQL